MHRRLDTVCAGITSSAAQGALPGGPGAGEGAARDGGGGGAWRRQHPQRCREQPRTCSSASAPASNDVRLASSMTSSSSRPTHAFSLTKSMQRPTAFRSSRRRCTLGSCEQPQSNTWTASTRPAIVVADDRGGGVTGCSAKRQPRSTCERLTSATSAAREAAGAPAARRSSGGSRVSLTAATCATPSGVPVRPCTSSAACWAICTRGAGEIGF